MEKNRKSLIGMLLALLLPTPVWARGPSYNLANAQCAPQYVRHNYLYNSFAGANDTQIPADTPEHITPFTDVALKQLSLAPT
jgi:hypothetical protein